MASTLINTAGEVEPEKFSRRANGIEALGVITAMLVLLWPVAFAGDILGGQAWISDAVRIVIGLLFAFILLVSPRLHGDRLDTWGLGNPRTLLRLLSEGPWWKRLVLAGIVAGLFLGLNLMFFRHWPHVAKFFSLHKIGLSSDPLLWHLSWPGRWLALAAGGAISTLFVGWFIRYDNFLSAARTALKISLPFLALLLLSAWLHRGAAAFDELSLSRWMLGVFGYVFWGAVQQLIFSGYFGTRLRKAFAPGQPPGNQVPRERRRRVTLTFALGFALAGLSAIAVAIVVLHGGDKLDAGALGWLAGLLALGGWVFGHHYCRDKRRLMVATLTGGCFGIIHIDSYGLVFLTWGLGTVLAYVFMEASKRNVIALGLIHGLLGSTLGSLFSHKESGALEIDYHVGPWNIEEPSWTALLVPCLCIAGLVWLMRGLRMKD